MLGWSVGRSLARSVILRRGRCRPQMLRDHSRVRTYRFHSVKRMRQSNFSRRSPVRPLACSFEEVDDRSQFNLAAGPMAMFLPLHKHPVRTNFLRLRRQRRRRRKEHETPNRDQNWFILQAVRRKIDQYRLSQGSQSALTSLHPTLAIRRALRELFVNSTRQPNRQTSGSSARRKYQTLRKISLLRTPTSKLTFSLWTCLLPELRLVEFGEL